MARDIFDEFSRLQHEMSRFMNHLQNLHKIPAGFSTTPTMPQINVYEKEGEFIVLADIAGVDPKQLRLTVENNTLILQGEKLATDSVQNSRCQHMEIVFGPFVRSVKLTEPVDADRVEAHYRQGYLEIIVPKKHAGKGPRDIPVRSKE